MTALGPTHRALESLGVMQQTQTQLRAAQLQFELTQLQPLTGLAPHHQRSPRDQRRCHPQERQRARRGPVPPRSRRRGDRSTLALRPLPTQDRRDREGRAQSRAHRRTPLGGHPQQPREDQHHQRRHAHQQCEQQSGQRAEQPQQLALQLHAQQFQPHARQFQRAFRHPAQPVRQARIVCIHRLFLLRVSPPGMRKLSLNRGKRGRCLGIRPTGVGLQCAVTLGCAPRRRTDKVLSMPDRQPLPPHRRRRGRRPAAVPGRPRSRPRRAPTPRTPWRVLIVDDDTDVPQGHRAGHARPAHRGPAADLPPRQVRRRGPLPAGRGARHCRRAAGRGDGVRRRRPAAGPPHPRGTAAARRAHRAAHRPARLRAEIETVQTYDINDYKTKSELTRTRLYTVLTAAIRSYRQIRALEANRQGLEMIVEAKHELGRQHGLHRFAEGVLADQPAAACGARGQARARRPRPPAAAGLLLQHLGRLRERHALHAADGPGLQRPAAAAANRTRFIELLEQNLKSPEGITLALIDLDDFADVNDAFGHRFGDQVLQAVSQRMAQRWASTPRWRGSPRTPSACWPGRDGQRPAHRRGLRRPLHRRRRAPAALRDHRPGSIALKRAKAGNRGASQYFLAGDGRGRARALQAAQGPARELRGTPPLRRLSAAGGADDAARGRRRGAAALAHRRGSVRAPGPVHPVGRAIGPDRPDRGIRAQTACHQVRQLRDHGFAASASR
ncbi:diguanylate cyclase, GGDEF domain-containing protein [Ditylenchus destructor]|nr:diguanylate cyclase, GGDEF domain-containing protein [Ditylenchus destructor]